MSDQQSQKTTSGSKTPLIIGGLVVLALAGGAGFFLLSNEEQEITTAQVTEEEITSAVQRQEPADIQESNAAEDKNNLETAASEEAEESADEQGKEEQVKPFEVKPGNPTVAVVDGKDVKRVDVYNYIQTLPQDMQNLPPNAIYPLALEQVINARLIQNRAEKADLEQDELVQEQLDAARQQIIRNVYIQREIDSKIKDSELKKKYDEFIKEFGNIQERQASHILVETEEEAKELITQLNDGADFAELAREHSTGPSGSNGGDLGWFAKQDMVPEFAEAAFSMKKGDVSNAPVQTQFGFHVIKVNDSRTRENPSFEQLADSLRAQLRREKLDETLNDWREKAEIEVFDINGEPLPEKPEEQPSN